MELISKMELLSVRVSNAMKEMAARKEFVKLEYEVLRLLSNLPYLDSLYEAELREKLQQAIPHLENDMSRETLSLWMSQDSENAARIMADFFVEVDSFQECLEKAYLSAAKNYANNIVDSLIAEQNQFWVEHNYKFTFSQLLLRLRTGQSARALASKVNELAELEDKFPMEVYRRFRDEVIAVEEHKSGGSSSPLFFECR